jgi:hypothetical protein
MRDAMDTFHALLDNHKKIDRKVEEIPGGVMTVTTSKDQDVRDLGEVPSPGGSGRHRWHGFHATTLEAARETRMGAG